MFIENVDEILDTLETSDNVFLYDTVAISEHELVFHREGINLAKEFVGTAPIVITDTIYKELTSANHTEKRYEEYFQQFYKVLLIHEETLINYFYEIFSPKQQAIARYKRSSIRAFQTIQSLAASINQLSIKEIPHKVPEMFHSFFSSGKNKGEYSLLWLSTVLTEICPPLNIFFLGIDRDLYKIVDYCYFRFNDILSELRNRLNIEILSPDKMLQALIRQNKDHRSLYMPFRDENRKVLFKEITNGITSHRLSEASMDDATFIKNVRQSKVDIIF